MKIYNRSPFWRRAFRALGLRLFKLAENDDEPRLERNGEAWLLRSLLANHAAENRSGRPFVVYDAGANEGDYTGNVLTQADRIGCGVEIHLFEPSPFCVETLRKRFGGEAAARITCAALSDQEGSAWLHGGKNGSSQASLVVREGVKTDESIQVPLIRLGDYLAARTGARVDLLKLDVEGAELAALRGLGVWLRPEVIETIQFEYGGTTLDAGVSLRDLFRLLEARVYVLAKLLPSALEVRTYRPWMEHYSCANYVAISPRLTLAGLVRP